MLIWKKRSPSPESVPGTSGVMVTHIKVWGNWKGLAVGHFLSSCLPLLQILWEGLSADYPP